ncbi:MAG: hypothetical protein BVN34_00950 [Proteobacteria bacterium ST_bin12]|nr:MAG: hypothetical protein BVN34_00950 [Proteobacteria bacterium ST_bin12]
MDNLDDYWLALDRLKKNKPLILPKNSLINKDTVALEAGRKRGSIKKSRSNFNELILAIQLAAELTPNASKDLKCQLENVRTQKDNYRDFYHQSLNRELMLIERLAQLEKLLKRYVNVTPIKS